jgi:hypothetical protein
MAMSALRIWDGSVLEDPSSLRRWTILYVAASGQRLWLLAPVPRCHYSFGMRRSQKGHQLDKLGVRQSITELMGGQIGTETEPYWQTRPDKSPDIGLPVSIQPRWGRKHN